MTRRTAWLPFVLAALLATACGDRSGKTLDDPVFPPPDPPVASSTLPLEPSPPEIDAPLTMTAPWVDGSEIPARYTCLGEGVSPALDWSNVPPDAAELALTVVDVDAGDAVHWLVYGFSPGESRLFEGQPPEFGFEWENDVGSPDYEPPCPPAGETHAYAFTLYALGQQLEVGPGATPAEFIAQLELSALTTAGVSGLVTAAP